MKITDIHFLCKVVVGERRKKVPSRRHDMLSHVAVHISM
jgi:hypothetical protein